MLTIHAEEAQARFPFLLDVVERGERVRIERNGQMIAEIQPAFEKPVDQAAVSEAIAAMKEFRKRTGKMSLPEIFAARDEGRA
jgi:antitoxin (DNA-binding transcriptional repressor) of toxin-antitoxin stability system